MLHEKLKSTSSTIATALRSKRRLAIATVSAIALAFLSIYVPTVIMPGNTISYQLSLLKLENVLLIIVFSVLFGVSMALHSYANSLKKVNAGLVVGEGSATGAAGMVGGMLSMPLCASCVSIILSAVGLGSSSVFFVLSHRTEILMASILVITASIYFAGKRVTNYCEKCKIN